MCRMVEYLIGAYNFDNQSEMRYQVLYDVETEESNNPFLDDNWENKSSLPLMIGELTKVLAVLRGPPPIKGHTVENSGNNNNNN
jgi:hypothetical protein